MNLFDLETSLAPRGARKATPRKGASVRASGGRAMAFDHGEPVRLEVGGDLQRLARMSPRASHGGQASEWVKSTSVALVAGDERGGWVVEPFEEPREVERGAIVRTSAMCLPDRIDAPSSPGSGDADADSDTIELQPPATAGTSRGADREMGGEANAARGREAQLAMARARHAEQVSAFERDLQGLSAQQQRQFPAAASPTAPPPAPAASAASPRAPAGGGHDVFDRMGEGMAYATTFALPPVGLRREFREFDAQLDAPSSGARAKGASASLVAPPTLPVPSAGVGDEVLESDLDALERIQRPSPDAAAPAGTEPVHPRPTEDASNEGEQ